ncbi:MAG TPA: alpha-L-fucosidase [Blastocatellia bacterium]|nr:alpha-L-fucosidase [Blastocatellia bacterium]
MTFSKFLPQSHSLRFQLMAMVLLPIVGLALVASQKKVSPPQAFGATPSPRQWQWHQLEMYAFVHFTINTFTDREWGYGDEDPGLFNPTDFDANQIVETLKRGGMKGLILTAKHHDGFCLWPTKTTSHNIARSSWRNGRGDVVRELSDACRRHGLKFGVYLSPWDRNSAAYGKPEYLSIYREQLRELLTGYGPLFEVWHDGANGGDGYYGGARETRRIDKARYYDWPNTWAMVRQYQPEAVIFSDAGPDVRWVGNERGIAGETCWSTIDPEGIYPGLGGIEGRLNRGDRHGAAWRPAECDVSIRPGWFWHEKENGQVKSPRQLLDLYFASVGRGASFLLNVPPDRRGRIQENDARALQEFGDLLKETFASNLAQGARAKASNIRGGDRRFGGAKALDDDRSSFWATDDQVTTAELELDLKGAKSFNLVRLCENIQLGQRVEEFAVEIWKDGAWVGFGAGSSMGAQRLIRGERVTTDKVRIRIIKAAAGPCLSEVSLFAEPLK